jgi:DNA-damage-inducible protein D
MESNNALAIFQGTKIRKTWNNKEWWFALEDIIQALTDSRDVKQYINKLRQRDEDLSKGWGQIVHTLSIQTPGGSQKMNCTKNTLILII